jgi:uncharacterized membrane protein/uncharacterized membrane protein YeaQ/YmgE (transglycosylase-associated protein family)
VIAVTALLYVPLAVSYMWYLFDPGAPQLQDAVTSAVNGREYAVGQGSVHWARDADYAANRWVMLLHTSLGGLALGLAMIQFSGRIRAGRPAVHRWIGRTYFVLVNISMAAAILYLFRTAPLQYFGGFAFHVQLWMLAVGTLFSLWYAIIAIRRGDVVTHRAWIGMNVALMMTAPLLRVVWVFLAPLRPEHELIINLGIGAIMLAVIAPAGGAVAFMLTQRRKTSEATLPVPVNVILGVVAALVAGTLAVTLRFASVSGFPAEGLVIGVVQAWAYAFLCLAGLWRACIAGNERRASQWRWLTIGSSLTLISAALVAFAADPVQDSLNALITGLMIGPPVPIALTFFLVVDQAGRQRRAARAAARPPVLEGV